MTNNFDPSATKPAGIILRENLRIGAHPWLYNKDRTRYGGLTVIPKHLSAIKDDDKRQSSITNFLAIMRAKPLTDEEKQQEDEWNKLILNPGPLDYLDDDYADDVIAWCEGRGECPDAPKGCSATEPASTILIEDLLIGTHPRLYNKDRTRYGGLTVIPKHLSAIEDDDKRKSSIDDFLSIMAAKPLTDEEKRQKDEWDKLISNPGPLDYLDDDYADDVIAWSEGRGEYPAAPKGSTVKMVEVDSEA